MCQVRVENRDSMTARAMKAHSRHFSYMNDRQFVQVHATAGSAGAPARVGSSAFLGATGSGSGATAAAGMGRTAAGMGAVADSENDGGGCDDPCGGASGFPRSFSPMFGKSRMTGELYSGKASLKRGCVMFQEWLRAAKARLYASEEVTDPVVISSESIKERRPVRIVATLHAGFHCA